MGWRVSADLEIKKSPHAGRYGGGPVIPGEHRIDRCDAREGDPGGGQYPMLKKQSIALFDTVLVETPGSPSLRIAGTMLSRG